MTAQANLSATSSRTSGGRQPLLWAALALAAGICTGVYAWRPPLWWLVAWVVFAGSGAYWLRRRQRGAFALGLGAMFILGALLMQVRVPDSSGDAGLLRFTDGSEVLVTAHVIREGPLQVEDGGAARQRLDVETELISKENENVAVHSGLRINTYDPPPKHDAAAKQTAPAAEDKGLASGRVFHYGECLRFPAKIYPP